MYPNILLTKESFILVTFKINVAVTEDSCQHKLHITNDSNEGTTDISIDYICFQRK